jgi:hypothetical protein
MGSKLKDNIERGCVGLSRRFGKVWWYMNSIEISSRAVRTSPRGWAVQEDGHVGRGLLAFSLKTVAPEEETFWALQGLSVRGVWVTRISASER